MKYSYKITKYKPTKGVRRFDKNQWTSYSDVGNLVSLEKYLVVESDYINTVIEICNCMGIKNFRLSELELYDESFNLFENKKIEISELPDVLKLILREEVWFKLISKNCQFHFGYDYYMYFVSSKDFSACFDNVSDKLYLEVFRSPYLLEE